MKKVFIRADSSEGIGSGHIMRCLALAKELANEKNVPVEFICQDLPGNVSFLIQQSGFTVNLFDPLPIFAFEWDVEQTLNIAAAKDLSLLVVDSYQINEDWINEFRSQRPNVYILAIDDLANRYLPVDALLNQNLLPNLPGRYESLVPKDCRFFLGPKYALLRDEFYQAKDIVSKSFQRPSILVFFGGTDPTGETLKVLPILEALSSDYDIEVITGAKNSDNCEIKSVISTLERVTYSCQVSNISDYMARARFSIGAGGSSCLERMFYALPSITIVTADNQREATEYYHSEGLVKNLGWHDSVSTEDIYKACMELMRNQEMLLTYHANMREISVGSLGGNYVAKSL